ncbi:hypothetical protein OS493_033936 [Desmophyllum pertusum]|uniref:Uncharacterized protein n=1 Tax=Desmophyllum pertusum TaxID=174260 RepID=A0A9W9ZXQ3_9CNID|nr:hypothetical protein OS493_033936 [Desmophyllum pertusum]
MQLETKLFNTVKDLYLTKSRALEHIRRLFDTCKRKRVQPMLYYTGHGETGTGNWCFADGTISIQEIVDSLPGGTYYPMIFSDACYSGHWANFCVEKNIGCFHCLAACPEYSTAIDTEGEGGDLTLFMTGKKPRPSTEPMYSGGRLRDFPITSGYDSVDYTGFISSHIRNSQKILISQSMCYGTFGGCFAPSKRYSPRPALTWVIRKNYDTFLELVRETVDIDQWKKKYNDGFKITACAARGSTFYVIMTKDTEEYKGKAQSWFTRSTWAEAINEIGEKYKEGKVITGLCYSSGLGMYGVVMTGKPEGQCYHRSDDAIARSKWMDEKFKEGYHPTIIFKDPTNRKILVVMTEDQNRSGLGYNCTFSQKIVFSR